VGGKPRGIEYIRGENQVRGGAKRRGNAGSGLPKEGGYKQGGKEGWEE